MTMKLCAKFESDENNETWKHFLFMKYHPSGVATIQKKENGYAQNYRHTTKSRKLVFPQFLCGFWFKSHKKTAKATNSKCDTSSKH